MVAIDVPASLESFRRFVIASTCSSYIPRSYIEDQEVFPEREETLGSIYVEAADKVTLKWRQLRRKGGKVTGEASPNSLVNLSEGGVITPEWVDNYLKKKSLE